MKAAVGQLVDLRVDGLPARQLSTSIRVSEDGKETRGRSGETMRGSRGPSPRATKGAGDRCGLRHGRRRAKPSPAAKPPAAQLASLLPPANLPPPVPHSSGVDQQLPRARRRHLSPSPPKLLAAFDPRTTEVIRSFPFFFFDEKSGFANRRLEKKYSPAGERLA